MDRAEEEQHGQAQDHDGQGWEVDQDADDGVGAFSGEPSLEDPAALQKEGARMKR